MSFISWKRAIAKVFKRQQTTRGHLAVTLAPIVTVLEDRLNPSLNFLGDLNPIGNMSSNPANSLVLGKYVYFSASVNTAGNELWKSDGTSNGTVLVSDINPGEKGSYVDNLTNVNGTLFFTADDGTHGTELWKSDGTANGTVPLKDIWPGRGGSVPSDLTNVNGTLFFTAEDPTNGKELWKSDGTLAGTVLVKDIYPGSGNYYYSANDSNPFYLTNVNGILFFTANNGTNGNELWKSDGTAAGTVLVRDILPGSEGAYPLDLTSVNGTLFFSTEDGPDRGELWKSDGTTSGTMLVKDIRGGSAYYNSYPRGLADINGTLYFRANDGTNGNELWKSDGTANGTVLVKDISPGSSGSYPFLFTNVNGTLFFSASDDTHGSELWMSDGTAAGTKLVKDIGPGQNNSIPKSLINNNGKLYFTALDDGDIYRQSLWMSDGTEEGTRMVQTLGQLGYGNTVTMIAAFNGSVFFDYDDSIHGKELWITNGTQKGTMMVKDINRSTVSGLSTISNNTNVNGTLFFTADDGVHGVELWKSDGTQAGTVLVRDVMPGQSSSNPGNLANINGTLYFSATDNAFVTQLWKSDGTTQGTVLVKNIYSGPSDYLQYYSPRNFTAVNGSMFFVANDGTNGWELWKSDGTPSGTKVLKDIAPGSSSSSPYNLTNANGTLFFSADDGSNGNELWKSDGTASGTVMVKDIYEGSTDFAGPNDSFPSYLTNVNGTLYFEASDSSLRYKLWKSDGTSNGTVLVKDINPEGYSFIRNLTNVNGTLFFNGDDSKNGSELWKSDGTSLGTVMIKDIFPGSPNGYPIGSNPRHLTGANGKLFFTANDGIHGDELWVSDGTNGGTNFVKSFGDLGYGGQPSITAFNGSVFFTLNDGVHGQELWVSDGSQNGTKLVTDLVPGMVSSNPQNLTAAGTNLFFSANDELHGRELWAFDGNMGPVITSPASAAFTYGQSVNFTALVTGITSPTFSVTTGSLPSGITLNSKTGLLSGKTSAGEYKFTIAAISGQQSATQAFTLTINKAVLTITPSNLTKTKGKVYSFTGLEFTATGLVQTADKVTKLTITSAGAPATALAGMYEILGSNPTGTGLSNYNITIGKGVLTVGAINTAPSGADKTITVNEDQSYSFKIADFGFTDSVDKNQLLSVKITTLPAKGTLKLNGVALTSKNNTRDVLAAEIESGLLSFTSLASENGTKYASLAFQVRDNGGTADGGKDLDPTANTFVLNVNAVNDAPIGSNKTVSINEDAVYKFGLADFPFTDLENNALSKVKFTALPGSAKGSLQLNGLEFNGAQEVSGTDISKGLLSFTPIKDGNGTNFATLKFQIRDIGGTLNNGVDLDPTARTLTINVTAVNDAPIGLSKSITFNEDTVYKFGLTDFPFTDVEGDGLSTVKITTLPVAAKGSLKLNGVAVLANQEVKAADVSKGLLSFTPVKDGNGANFAQLKFQVRDTGKTANGGTDLDQTAKTLTINVTAVNDAPVLTTVTTLTGAKKTKPFEITYEMLAAAANEKDVDGDPVSFRIQAVSSGKVEKFDGANWVTVTPGQTLLSAKEKIRWTSTVAGTGLNAFTIVGWDGLLPSTPNVQVKISVSN